MGIELATTVLYLGMSFIFAYLFVQIQDYLRYLFLVLSIAIITVALQNVMLIAQAANAVGFASFYILYEAVMVVMIVMCVLMSFYAIYEIWINDWLERLRRLKAE